MHRLMSVTTIGRTDCSVSRHREHLYRAHKIPPHCKRCWKVFEKETELDEHIMVPAADICETRPGTSPAGITPDQVNQLRSRKKSSRNQTDEDRWHDMYRLLFPNDVIPSPCESVVGSFFFFFFLFCFLFSVVVRLCFCF